MSRILIAIVIVLIISNVATAVGWAVAAGKIVLPTGLAALAGPNTKEAPAPKSKEQVDADEDDSPAPRGDEGVAGAPGADEDDSSLMDRVGSAFGSLKSAVMVH